jgi:hypothetical protein
LRRSALIALGVLLAVPLVTNAGRRSQLCADLLITSFDAQGVH